MKGKLLLLSILLVGILYYGCEEPIDPLTDTGTLFVSSEPEEAAIYVDGKNTSKLTPTDVEVPGGVHQITLKKEGYADYNFMDTIVIGIEQRFTEIKMTKYGLFVLKSEPSNANIYIDNKNQLVATPKTFAQPDGTYTVTLKTENYIDSTFDISILDAQDVEKTVYMRPNFVTHYTGIVLYDTTGAAANEPSGLNLSTGRTLNIDLNSGQKAEADLVFIPNEFGGFDIKTPNGTNGMFRDTRFLVTKSDNINDHVNSPTEDPTWRNYFPSTTENYVFAYSSDGHYSKIKIVRRLENPTRVELRWIYNDNSFDVRF